MDKGIRCKLDTWQVRGHQVDPHLLPIDLGGKKRERERKREEEESFRERISHFSLEFPVIGPSNFDETRGKVDPYCTIHAWIPILWSFDKLWEVGVLLLLVLVLV